MLDGYSPVIFFFFLFWDLLRCMPGVAVAFLILYDMNDVCQKMI